MKNYINMATFTIDLLTNQEHLFTLNTSSSTGSTGSNYLSGNTDVSIVNPTVDNLLKYNGFKWVNAPETSISAGAGVAFFLDKTKIITGGTQSIDLQTLSKQPNVDVEIMVSTTLTNTTVLINRFLYNQALDGTLIDSGVWIFNSYNKINDTDGVTTTPISIHKVITGVGVVNITGSSTTRTASVVGGALFLAGDIGTDLTNCGVLQTPKGVFEIKTFISASIVEITTPATYINESGVTYSIHRHLFTDPNIRIDHIVEGLTVSQSTQSAFVINSTDKFSVSYFGRTTSMNPITIDSYYNGTEHYSHIISPLATRHNDLAGLQGGSSTQRVHLTNTEYAVVSGIKNKTYALTGSTICSTSGFYGSGANLTNLPITNLVPYTGANQSVILGVNSLTATTVCSTLGFYGSGANLTNLPIPPATSSIG